MKLRRMVNIRLQRRILAIQIRMINNSDGSTSGTASSKRDRIYPNMKQKETIFVLCDTCYWSATFFTKLMLPAENRCPQCQNTELSSFPILPNESFIWNHSEKRGIELEFRPRET